MLMATRGYFSSHINLNNGSLRAFLEHGLTTPPPERKRKHSPLLKHCQSQPSRPSEFQTRRGMDVWGRIAYYDSNYRRNFVEVQFLQSRKVLRIVQEYRRILYGTILRSGTPLILFLMVTYPVQLIKIVCLHAKIPVQDGGATEGLCLNPSGQRYARGALVRVSESCDYRNLSVIAIWRTILVTPFATYQQSSDVIEPDMNIITCFTCEEYIVEFKSRKFCYILSGLFLHPYQS